MDRVKRTVESERLRSALLTSISHDLKTPLASVLGAASTLRDLAGSLTDAQKRELLATVIDEIRAAEPLHRQSARHDQAGVRRHRAEYRAARSQRDRRQRARGAPARSWCQHKVSLELAADLPMLELDAVLFEQVLFNLLDNAAKYAPRRYHDLDPGRCATSDSIALQIIDEGGGIPPAELESVFDKFYRAQKGDHVRPGTGLGLAISRGFVEAMHGTISAANRTDRSGAVLTIRLSDPRCASTALDTAA